MKKYSKYKPSSIEWLGDIPEHWERKRLKDYMGVNMGQSPDSESYNDEGLGLPFYQGNADFGELYPIKRIYCDEPKKIATKNDILISVRAPVGEMNISDSECCIGRGLTALTVKTGDYKYAYYLLFVIKEELKMFVTGSTFEAVSANDISVIKYLNPTQTEQTAISNYLDVHITKLDKLIKNKEDQIEELKEIRQIEINTVVTKGLNLKAKMKNSGIDWLGEIPAEWEVERIKNVCEVNPKKCDSGFSSDSTMPVVFLPMESVSESGEFDDSVRIPINELWSGFTYFKRGDIVLAKITPCFENGKCACLDHLSTEIGFGTTEFHVLRPSSKRVFNRFIYYITKSEMFMQFGKALMTGAAGQKRVPTEFIQTFKIAVPGIKEQIQITDYLDERISIIDRLILNFVYEIEKLKEIRKIEIYNAVTGKIKVI